VAARPIERVAVKGKSTPVLVYELLGLSEDAGADARRLTALHERGLEHYLRREWAEAIAAFEEIIEVRPGDGPATEFLRRCHVFQQAPPGPDWDGLHRLHSK
jgi:adenylate cyclase